MTGRTCSAGWRCTGWRMPPASAWLPPMATGSPRSENDRPRARRGRSTPASTCCGATSSGNWRRNVRWSAMCCPTSPRAGRYAAPSCRAGSSTSASPPISPAPARNFRRGCGGRRFSSTATACSTETTATSTRSSGSSGPRERARRSGWRAMPAGTCSSSPTSRGWRAACTTRRRCAACTTGWPTKSRRAGGTIDDFRFCPHHPEGTVPEYRRTCDCRKPAPGMLLDLLRAWNVDPARCALIGDQETDLQAATAAGIPRQTLFRGGDLSGPVRAILALAESQVFGAHDGPDAMGARDAV